MATVAKRRNKWVCDWRDATGRRRWKTFERKKDAVAYRDEVSTHRRQGIVTDDRATFDQLVADYKLTHLETSVRPATKADYESLLTLHIEPFFSGYRLRDIQRETVLKFRADMLKKEVGTRTINKALSLLGTLFSNARMNGRAHHQPVQKVMLPKDHGEDFDGEEIEVLSQDEQRQLIDATKGGMRMLLLTALSTGLRQGELFGLKWDDIDFKQGKMHVKRQFTRGTFAPLKTACARRTIPLPDSLVRELKQWKLACPPGDLVFPNSQGRPQCAANFVKREYYPALKRAGVRRVNFHSLRHCFASNAIHHGLLNVKALQRVMGHSSATITLNTYAHMLPGGDDGVAIAAESALFGSKVVAGEGKAGN